jgi:hypothetical protein
MGFTSGLYVMFSFIFLFSRVLYSLMLSHFSRQVPASLPLITPPASFTWWLVNEQIVQSFLRTSLKNCRITDFFLGPFHTTKNAMLMHASRAWLESAFTGTQQALLW